MSDIEQSRAEALAYYEACMERVRTTPEPRGQKYPIGTRVFIKDDLGPFMDHFPRGVKATVAHTYAHAYGGNDVASYALDVDGFGKVAWYYESQLLPI